MEVLQVLSASGMCQLWFLLTDSFVVLLGGSYFKFGSVELGSPALELSLTVPIWNLVGQFFIIFCCEHQRSEQHLANLKDVLSQNTWDLRIPPKISMPKDIPIIRKFRIFIGIYVRGSKIGDPNKKFSQLILTLHQISPASPLPSLVNRCSLWVAPGASFSPPFGMRNCPNLPIEKASKKKKLCGVEISF